MYGDATKRHRNVKVSFVIAELTEACFQIQRIRLQLRQ